MSSLLVLEGVGLTPVVELHPAEFATRTRTSPSGSWRDLPEEWHRFWSDSLADSGLAGLTPLRRGGWLVPTTEFADPATLGKFLKVVIDGWGGVVAFDEPEWEPVLNGGFALHTPAGGVLVEPGCCSDLGNFSSWRDAAGCRRGDWQMLWVGHPWLSVKYGVPWLVVSDLHESDAPRPRWAVDPDDLGHAVAAAGAELEQFARRIAPLLTAQGYPGDALLLGRKLAGLEK